jgi:hypothetical protein
MSTVLDYADKGAISHWRVGVGYFVIVAVNLVSLVIGAVALRIGASGDGYAPMYVMFIGPPLLLGQALLGGLPAWLYLGRHSREMYKWPRAILFTLSILPSVAVVVGIVLALTLPTRFGRC